MKEIKFRDTTAIKTRTVTKYAVVLLHPDGSMNYIGLLHDTYEKAKIVYEGMEEFYKSKGDEETAREYAECRYYIYPVEVTEPVLGWADVKGSWQEEAAEKREVA